MNQALIDCLTGSNPPALAEPVADLTQWRNVWARTSACAGNAGSASQTAAPGAQVPRPIDRAIAAGYQCDRLGWAFLAGYQAAIRVIDASLTDTQMASFCVTEAAGNQPRHIQTRIDPAADGSLMINGQKSWLALGNDCDVLYVAGALGSGASEGVSDNESARRDIRLVRIPTKANGVTIQVLPTLAFIPEVPHAGATFTNVVLGAGAMLDGDGYSQYVKPFRTIEDICNNAAMLAYLLREARARQWPAAFIEQLIAAISGLSSLAGDSPQAPAIHLALTGQLHWISALYQQADHLWALPGREQGLATIDGHSAASRWRRDRKLLGLASKVRELRADRAWKQLTQLD